MTGIDIPRELLMIGGETIRLMVAGLLLAGAAAKFRDLPQARATVADYELLPKAASAAAAFALALAEAGVGLWLVVAASRAAALSAAMLLTVFSLAVTINLARGRRDIGCGCDWSGTKIIGWPLVARNLSFVWALGALGAQARPDVAIALVGAAVSAAMLSLLLDICDRLSVAPLAAVRMR